MVAGVMVRRMNLNFLARSCALFFFAVAGSAVAADLPDPTRPPQEITASYGSEGNGIVGGAAAQATAIAANRGLQSVIIAPHRRAAMFNGQTVELGEKYGDAELIEVSEDGVVLQSPLGRQKLLLIFPGVAVKKRVALQAKPADEAKTELDEDKVKHTVDILPQGDK
jgi:MSHA biogenesis protein MshK